MSLRVAVVAGEASGDQLGAALMRAIRARAPHATFFGVAGPRMISEGCEEWAAAEELAVMGLAEVVRHLPRLMKLRKSLVERFAAAKPDVFVGIDAPEFNLGLAARLKRRGIRTVQYVSPQVWAWRQGRVQGIGEACDLVLCLLPFETAFYEQRGVAASFVGHPLADQIPLGVDRAAARSKLGIADAAPVVALLPGSRLGEVERLGADFIGAAAWIHERRPDVRFVAAMASPAVSAVFDRQCATVPVEIQRVTGRAREVLTACDAALVASGTATLETLLHRRPMVVAYRLGQLTAFMLRRFGMVKVPYFSQPNLLLGRRAVPEFFQEAVRPDALGAALLHAMDDAEGTERLMREFDAVHEQLKRDGAAQAASAILDVVGEPQWRAA